MRENLEKKLKEIWPKGKIYIQRLKFPFKINSGEYRFVDLETGKVQRNIDKQTITTFPNGVAIFHRGNIPGLGTVNTIYLKERDYEEVSIRQGNS